MRRSRRCLMTGLPRTITLNSDEMVEALAEPTETILETVHMVLERTPPELVADISENGIVMSGGKVFLTRSQTRPTALGSRLKRLRLAAAHSLRSHVCEPRSIFSDVHAAGKNA